MKHALVIAAAAAALLLAPAAWAGDESRGTVDAWDAESRMITFSDGSSITLAEGEEIGSIAPGAGVTYTWSDKAEGYVVFLDKPDEMARPAAEAVDMSETNGVAETGAAIDKVK